VISATVSMKRKLEAEYATLANGLFARKQQLFPADTYSFAAFQWAFTMLFSRAIRLTSSKSGEAVALTCSITTLTLTATLMPERLVGSLRRTRWLCTVTDLASAWSRCVSCIINTMCNGM
jgi:hypothetical protein